MKFSLLIASLIILSGITPVNAQGLLGTLLCGRNITEQMRDKWSGTGNFTFGYLDLEIMNNSSEYRITAVSIRFTGSYSERKFVRLYNDRELEIRPGTSARLIVETDISHRNFELEDIAVVEFFGCID